MSYDYKEMCLDLESAAEQYGIIEIFNMGKSVMERNIPCARIGGGKKKLFLSGAYHGLEYLTSAVLTRFLSDYAHSLTCGQDIQGYSASGLYNAITLLIAPMINPDGVDIAVNGIDLSNPFHRSLIENTGIHDFTHVWQANVRGVDINHNFNALWQSVREIPSPTKYGGPFPESEPETRAVTNFVRRENPDMLIAFHSQGGEIYYDFNGTEGNCSREIAQKLESVSGYKACVPEGTAVFGGCKDWFIDEFGKAGFTVEIGHGKNPLPLSMLGDVYDENARIILCAMSCLG